MFASQKGGVGKTATAVNTAAGLGERGARVLLVDTDPNGSLAACFGLVPEAGHPGFFGIMDRSLEALVSRGVAPQVDAIPYAADRRPLRLPEAEAALARLGAVAAPDYDFLIVDSRPSVQEMTRCLCRVVDEVVVVFQCQHLAFRTLCGILSELRDAKADGARARLAGLLLTMVDRSNPDQVQLEAQIRQSLGSALLPMDIPYDRGVSDAFADQAPVILAAPDSPAAAAYRQLSRWLLDFPGAS